MDHLGRSGVGQFAAAEHPTVLHGLHDDIAAGGGGTKGEGSGFAAAQPLRHHMAAAGAGDGDGEGCDPADSCVHA